MPRFTIEFTPAALRQLGKLDPRIGAKVFSDIERLKEDPRPLGAARMETKEKLYRVYVGPGKNYRAVYQIRDEVLLVLIVRVGDRKEVYRRM